MALLTTNALCTNLQSKLPLFLIPEPQGLQSALRLILQPNSSISQLNPPNLIKLIIVYRMGFNVDQVLQEIRKCKLPPESTIKSLCKKVIEIFFQQSNVQPICSPATLVGDIHGQFFDVLNILQIAKPLPQANFVFIGDFVDRGYHSVETITLLFSLKLKYPQHVTLLRGNHECRQVTMHYGFFDEVKRKYGNTKVWEYFTEAFSFLPLGGLIEGKILCIHGGLSPNIKTIDQIRALNRRMEISENPSISDLMWSDPSKDVEDWEINKRGAGYYFGEKVVKSFNLINRLNIIVRAHQLVDEGYQYWFDKQLVTVWSAPNYCYRAGNKASIMNITDELGHEFQIFNSAPQSDNSQQYPELMPYFL